MDGEDIPDDIIVPQQDLIAVYTNPADAVVIKQYVGDEQPFVYIHKQHLPALIEKLKSYLPAGR